MRNFTFLLEYMKNGQHRALPFLVTLAGCVMMLAWVDPANASEVTRQLTQKGYAISQLRKSEVAIVKQSNHDLQVFFKGFISSSANVEQGISVTADNVCKEYQLVFPNHVKSALKADIRTWLKRE